MPVHVPQRVLVAPSGFKESLDAASVAEAIAAGVRRVLPGVRLDLAPIPDGGEGTAVMLAAATGGTLRYLDVAGPVSAPVRAHWARLGGGFVSAGRCHHAGSMSTVRDVVSARPDHGTDTARLEAGAAQLDRATASARLGCVGPVRLGPGSGAGHGEVAQLGPEADPLQIGDSPGSRSFNRDSGSLAADRHAVAVVEMAAAAGLAHVPRDARDPGATTTFGVGQLIAAALDDGVDTVIVGCGDSGTCDGGAGALQALGARILDCDGHEIGRGGYELAHAEHLDLSGLHPRLLDATLVVAGNVHNVLCGPRGVARVFGPQKGAAPDQVERLSAALENWVRVLERDGIGSGDLRTGPVTGASGGLGAGLAAVGAQLRSRFDALLDSGLAGIDLDSRIMRADLVITAEGSIDFQTPHGKVPAEIARRAARHGVPVVALAGSLGEGAPAVHEVGIGAMASILTVPMPLSQAVAEAERLLIDAAERMMRMMLLGATVSDRARRSEDARYAVR
ncbi:glycerate kinase family protein [Nocardia donostiensis]|nr:glycerate kinase [Nocardia donostiensis]